MSRSVSVPSGAAEVFYFPARVYEEEDSFLAHIEFEEMVEDIKNILISRLPAMEDVEDDAWIGDECRVIMDNDLIVVSLSEYSGLCCLAFVPKAEIDESVWEPIRTKEFARAWSARVRESVQDALSTIGCQPLRRIGTFSNGEAVFEKIV